MGLLSEEGVLQMHWADASIPLLIGGLYTLLGGLKLYGLSRGIVGGRGKSVRERACGT
jgi:hypothetical protein